MTQNQTNLFTRVTEAMSAPRSLANSAAIIAWPETHFDWVRPGVMLYGASPFESFSGESHQLRAAMNLESQLFAIKSLKVGETVGYGATWRAERASEIGLITIGYGDGYPRHARPGTPVWINGERYPLVGRVSMDMLAVELGPKHGLALGERAVLWGAELPVDEVARWADTIPYTLLCGVTSRVNFVCKDDQDD